MPYDATRAGAFTIRAQKDEAGFDSGGRLGMLIGAMAFGVVGGAAAVIGLGYMPALAVNAGIAVVCAAAAYCAGVSFLEAYARGRALSGTLLGLNVLALVALPIVLQIAPAQALWATLAAYVTIVLFAATMRASDGAVLRLAAHGALLAFATSYQALFSLMA